jgi:hypothetical protein
MFFKLTFLCFLLLTQARDIFSLKNGIISSKEEFLLQEVITNLQDKNNLIQNGVSKLEECDLESNITEIMRLLEAQSEV